MHRNGPSSTGGGGGGGDDGDGGGSRWQLRRMPKCVWMVIGLVFSAAAAAAASATLFFLSLPPPSPIPFPVFCGEIGIQLVCYCVVV